jgi:protein TonB
MLLAPAILAAAVMTAASEGASTLVEAAAMSSAVTLRPAIPMNYPGTWATTNDYPVNALRNMEQGATGFALTIDQRGRVASCLVTESSGSLDLDEATCRLVSDRARFQPATDARGRAAQGSYTSRVHWSLPSARNALQPGSLRFVFTVAADGSKKDCAVGEAVGGAARDMPTGEVPCSMIPFSGRYTDDAGNGVPRRVTITQTVAVEEIR